MEKDVHVISELLFFVCIYNILNHLKYLKNMNWKGGFQEPVVLLGSLDESEILSYFSNVDKIIYDFKNSVQG
jgi:hypothetical protein